MPKNNQPSAASKRKDQQRISYAEVKKSPQMRRFFLKESRDFDANIAAWSRWGVSKQFAKRLAGEAKHQGTTAGRFLFKIALKLKKDGYTR